jgi:hypothetical protein
MMAEAQDAPPGVCPFCFKEPSNLLFHLRTDHNIRDLDDYQKRMDRLLRMKARADELKAFLAGLDMQREANRITPEEYRARRATWEASHPAPE